MVPCLLWFPLVTCCGMGVAEAAASDGGSGSGGFPIEVRSRPSQDPTSSPLLTGGVPGEGEVQPASAEAQPSATLSLSGSPLVGSGSPTEGEELQAQHEAKLADPEAVAARKASRTKFANLTAAQAGSVAGEAFPELMNDTAGGAPTLPAGQAVESYLTNYAAQISGPEGGREVLESTSPMATETSSGQHIPTDLELSEMGGRFVARSPLVAVQIPKLLGEGVQFPGLSLSITPVDSQGTALSGSGGASDGTSVLYANTQTDADTVVKPTSAGVDALTVLRSVMSPQHLYFAVGLPAGAALVQMEASGPVHVVVAGKTIAMIQRPAAQDSAGTTVPVVMSVSGSTVALEVEDQSAEYLYPIAVDPEVTGEDKQVVETTGGKRSNWKFESTSEANFGHEPHEGPHKDEGAGKGYLETFGASEYKETETAFWAYETKGVSKIYEVNAKTEGKNKGAEIESFLELEHSGGSENKYKLSSETYEPEYGSVEAPPLCAKNGTKVECAPAAGTAGNAVRFQQSVQKKPSNDHFVDRLLEAIVYLSEPAGTHSTTKFNTTSPEVEGEVVNEKGEKAKQKRPNALYGSGGWLSNYQDAIEPIAEDSGIGVAATKLEYESALGKWEKLAEHNYLETENGCEGVQCFAKHGEYWTVAARLPQGEDKIRYRAEEAMRETESSEAEGQATVKVDTQPPHNMRIRGLPFGNELTERPYKLTVEATDGEGTTVASSGVKSIALYIDGREVGKPSGSCSVPKGECTASAEWTINGAELGAGHHSIQAIAFDNAGNEGRLSGGGTQISIRHSTPVPLGPGSVDLESGDFALGATDISMGSGLTVSRSYSSRDLSQGAEGPLGNQWSMSLGASESITELVDGSVLLTAANGNQTIFAKPATVKCEPGSPFESPLGDSNLKLWCEENTESKTRDAYYLEDTAAHTKDKFTQPGGEPNAEWVPTRQEGVTATDTVSYSYQYVKPTPAEYGIPAESKPWDIAQGPNGTLWFTDQGSNEIGSITTAGAVKEYSLPLKTVIGPRGITEGPEGNMWFANGRVGKITASGEVTEYAVPNGSEAFSITPGPEGYLWFTDWGTSKISKMSPSGVIVAEYSMSNPYDRPEGIVLGPEGDFWFTSYYSGDTSEVSTIGKITPTGVITEYALPENAEPAGIAAGPDGNLWYTDAGTNKIGKINANGEHTEYALPTGSAPDKIAQGSDGLLWFTDEGTAKIGRITTTGHVSEYALPAGSEPVGIASGPNGKLWYTDYGSNKIGSITPGTTEPTESLAPVPSGVSCSWKEKPTEMHAGCRALEFKYDTGATTASGESESEWGEYEGRLSRVSLVAYDPATTKMGETPVAEYAWDSRGYLRGEWDPRLKPAELKTTYGYDEEGHVTALTPPGQESWAFTYGPSETDPGRGRLVKADRALATQALWAGATVQNTALPVLSGSPVVGSKAQRMSVSTGTWSNSPITHGYQWELNPGGGGWTTILGATNSSYTLNSGDLGDELRATVSATSGGGTTNATTAAVEIGSGEGTSGEATRNEPGWTIDYNVPVTGSTAPHEMDAKEVAKWGQTDYPVEATAITPPDSTQGWPASSYKRSTVYYLDESGNLVNQSTPTAEAVGAITTTEYNEYNDVVKTLSAENRALALTAGCISEKSCESAEFAALLSTVSTYNEPECRRESDIKEKEAAEPGTRLCETWGPSHEIKYTPDGFKGQKESGARDHTEYFYEDAANGAPAGEHYDLVTETANLAQLFSNEGKPEEEVEIRKSTTDYSGQAGLGWTLRAPTSHTAATETGGAKTTNTTIYYETGEAKGQIKETRGPEGAAGGTAHDSRIVYYTAEENKEGYPGCGKRPEWAGLTCETMPAKQPAEVSGLPSLPDTTTTYNMWDEPIKVEEVFPKTATFPETKRTKIEEYDKAGRLSTSETTSTSTKDVPLPKVTDTYNTATGGLETQGTEEVSKKTVTITTKNNRLGQLESYTDSDGNTAKYVYGGPDSLLEEMSDSSGASSAGEHRSTQKYKYNETTKAMTSIIDSAAGTFTATYGLEGKVTSETYPNGMCANYTRNPVGEDIHIEYIKTTNCAEKGAAVWFSESRSSSIRGEVMSRTTTLASYAYLHNSVGQLIEAQETPTGSYCKVRAYTYNEEADRKSAIAREPNTKHECATEGGTEEKHTYNEANTLADSGIEYEALGNVTKLPAADAEGHELKSTFYADGAVAVQEQISIKNTYRLDPNGRNLETTTGSKAVISHYDGPGEAVAWRCELSATTKECEEKKYVRNIPGFGGSLSAVQTNGATPVLQLHNLEGDVIATAADNTTETKLLSTYNSTEFGVPNAGKAPPPFAWLGAADIESALPTGVITYGATSYVPQTGLALQAGEVEPPGAATGNGVGTPYTCQLEPWVTQGATREANEAPGIGAAEEHEALMRAWEAALAADPVEIIHYREWEARQKIEAINQALAWGNLAEGVSSIFGTAADYLKGYAEGLFTTAVGWGWIEEYGEFLEGCLNRLQASHDSHGGCRAEFHIVDFGVQFVNFLYKPLISECARGKANGDKIDNLELAECTLLGFPGEGMPIV
jgi:streptogramin lyase